MFAGVSCSGVTSRGAVGGRGEEIIPTNYHVGAFGGGGGTLGYALCGSHHQIVDYRQNIVASIVSRDDSPSVQMIAIWTCWSQAIYYIY